MSALAGWNPSEGRAANSPRHRGFPLSTFSIDKRRKPLSLQHSRFFFDAKWLQMWPFQSDLTSRPLASSSGTICAEERGEKRPRRRLERCHCSLSLLWQVAKWQSRCHGSLAAVLTGPCRQREWRGLILSCFVFWWEKLESDRLEGGTRGSGRERARAGESKRER